MKRNTISVISDPIRIAMIIVLLYGLTACGGGGGDGTDSGNGNPANNNPTPPASTTDTDNNNSFATASSFSGLVSITGSINDTTDSTDYYAFVPQANGIYKFTLKWNNHAANLDLSLFDATQALQATGKVLNDNSKSIDNIDKTSGSLVYLVVEAKSTAGLDVNYALIVDVDTPTPTIPDTDDNGEFENADEITSTGDTSDAVNHSTDAYDYYLFTAPSNGNYEFQLSWSDNAYDLDMVTFNMNHTILGTAIHKDLNPEIINNIALTTGQQIFIRIQGFDTNTTDVSYTLSISDTSGPQPPSSNDNDDNGSPSSATPFTSIGSATGAVDDIIDTLDFYTFTAVSDGTYHIQLTWSTDVYDLDLYIYNTSEFVIGESKLTETDFESTDNIVLTAGTQIYIAVRGFNTGGEIADYKLSITQQ